MLVDESFGRLRGYFPMKDRMRRTLFIEPYNPLDIRSMTLVVIDGYTVAC